MWAEGKVKMSFLCRELDVSENLITGFKSEYIILLQRFCVTWICIQNVFKDYAYE